MLLEFKKILLNLQDHLQNYRKESPTKISSYQKIYDSSDSIRKDLFNSFFSFEPYLEIDKEENDESITSRNLSEEEFSIS